MNNSIISASVSMGALQKRLDILADNIANVDTVGYKRKSAVFEDIMTSLQSQQEDFRLDGRRSPLGYTHGWGSRIASIQLDMTQGSLKDTGNPTDVAIEGNALFEVRTTDGASAYTRHGAFQLIAQPDGDRVLLTDTGLPVLNSNGAEIRVPNGYELKIEENGTLTANGPQGSQPIDLGKLSLVQVTKPEFLVSVGDNLYGVPADVNVDDVLQNLIELPQGVAVRQGFAEQSNVSWGDEMSDLLLVQRAYQLSARALSSSEQMMGMANNLRA
ncbi:flagellar hook-basal body protein [Cohnella faecalis]|uniref:Flagellar hook-basal body protein n=1 Tax=Cohnella faecalis TaxID=2315694 RepID=A0A398CHV1_9BACL|nr:flagellar hook-basal body protein [Cohnella faecalis]RIE02020.1 flagellar hook-basal body protein [Cohnella faecalis]